MSASTFLEQVERVIADGFDDFLRKPYRDLEVYRMLERHLDVRFAYEDDRDVPPVPLPVVDAARMAALPEAWRERFQEASLLGQLDEMERLVDALAEREPEVAAALRALVLALDLERILELLEG